MVLGRRKDKGNGNGQEPDWLEVVAQTERLRHVRVRRSVTRADVGEASAYLRAMAEEGYAVRRNLLIDLSGAERIDTAVVAYLIERLRVYRHEGFRVGLVGVGPEPGALLAISRVETWFEVYDSVAEATRALGSQPAG